MERGILAKDNSESLAKSILEALYPNRFFELARLSGSDFSGPDLYYEETNIGIEVSMACDEHWLETTSVFEASLEKKRVIKKKPRGIVIKKDYIISSVYDTTKTTDLIIDTIVKKTEKLNKVNGYKGQYKIFQENDLFIFCPYGPVESIYSSLSSRVIKKCSSYNLKFDRIFIKHSNSLYEINASTVSIFSIPKSIMN